MRRISLLFSMALAFSAQIPEPNAPPPVPNNESDTRLPNGKSQKDAIAKADYEDSLKDARELVKLSQSLQAELEKSDAQVISVSEIRKTEDIEKLAKRIRGRLKRF